jgi:cytidylate kinase
MAGHGTFSRRHFITSVAAVTGSAVVGSTLASKLAMGFSLRELTHGAAYRSNA